MKIKFYNLGTIKETELDLRPLTVIIGPNNSNKTYIAYSTYGLLKQLGKRRDIKAKIFKDDSNNVSSNINEGLRSFVQEVCYKACSNFADNLEVFYQDSSRKLFSETKFELLVTDEEIVKALQSTYNNVFLGYNGQEYVLELTDGLLIAYANKGMLVDGKARLLPYHVEYHFQPEFLKRLAVEQFLLPAERNAFIITYKMLLNKRFSLLRDRERQIFGKHDDQGFQAKLLREQGDIRYPQPIEDFLDMLSDIELSHKQVNISRAAQNSGQRNDSSYDSFTDVARQIERYIQVGNTTSYSSTTLGGSEIMVKVKKGLNIDLYNASSSIKQLAPLLLYLRYRAAENDLLIIDEPEMNLHPESQVKLLEILAILVNAGVRVMLTTHSPYFMSHLNNLTLSEQHSDSVKKKQATSLYLKDPRAFLSMEQVSAYEMRDNQLHSLKDEEFGIRYDTLSDVSIDVQQKYFEISEKGKTTRRGKAQQTRTNVS